MFLHHRARRMAFHVPVAWLACGTLFAAFGVFSLAHEPRRLGDSLTVGLLASGCLLYAGLRLRCMYTRGDRLHIRSLLKRYELKAHEAVLGYRVKGSSRYVQMQLYATDGSEPIALGEGMFGSQRAKQHLTRLTHTLQLGSGRAQAHASVARETAAIEQSEAQVAAYYRSARWRRSGRWLLLGLVGYLLVMLAMMWFGSH